MQVAFADAASNAAVVSEWIERWRPLAIDAVEARWRALTQAPVPLDPAAIARRVAATCAHEIAELLPPSS
jgi:hypothetical protein